MAMGLDLVAVLKRLGVNIDTHSPPITAPSVITWLGRLFDVSPEHSKLGMIEGMEVWTSGEGFAPLDLVGIETWLFDAPRGDHLIIAERNMTFDVDEKPVRDGRRVVIWTQSQLAEFIGHAVLDGSLVIVEADEVESLDSEPELFSGSGPFTLKPKNDFSELEIKGYDISMAKPVLIPAKIHLVTGIVKGPVEEEVSRWILNCDGLHIVEELDLLERSPILKHEFLNVEEKPNFCDVMTERRTHSDGMGDLLHWWVFDDDSAKAVEYPVLVPAHKGIDAFGKNWILNGVTGKIHTNF